MNTQLTEEQLAIQDMAAKFTADEITPQAAGWDEKKEFPRSTITQAGEDVHLPSSCQDPFR